MIALRHTTLEGTQEAIYKCRRILTSFSEPSFTFQLLLSFWALHGTVSAVPADHAHMDSFVATSTVACFVTLSHLESVALVLASSGQRVSQTFQGLWDCRRLATFRFTFAFAATLAFEVSFVHSF